MRDSLSQDIEGGGGDFSIEKKRKEEGNREAIGTTKSILT